MGNKLVQLCPKVEKSSHPLLLLSCLFNHLTREEEEKSLRISCFQVCTIFLWKQQRCGVSTGCKCPVPLSNLAQPPSPLNKDLDLKRKLCWGCFNSSLDRTSLALRPCFQSLGYATSNYRFSFALRLWWRTILKPKNRDCNPFFQVMTQCLGLYSGEQIIPPLIKKTLPFRLPKHTPKNSYSSTPATITTGLLQLHISTLKTILIAKCK